MCGVKRETIPHTFLRTDVGGPLVVSPTLSRVPQFKGDVRWAMGDGTTTDMALSRRNQLLVE